MRKFLLIITLLLTFSMQFPLLAQDNRREKNMIEELVLPELNVINNILYVKNAPIGKKIEIITIVGSKVSEIEIKSSEGTYELNLPKAIYIFKLEGIVRKFVIK